MHRLINSRRVELVLGSLLLSSFLAANLGTSSRSPVIWQDEVMFTDPAANLYFGQGFTTSAWFQSRGTLFAGNSPLYSLCLYPWMRVFGFDVVSVRGLNYVLILAVAAICLLALDRLGLVRSTVPRLVFTLLVLCGDGVTYSYRSGRYDCLGMLLVSGLFLTLSLRPSRARTGGLFVLAALVPWAGLQLLPYLALLGLLVLLLRGKAAIADLLTVGLGGLAGVVCLAAFLLENGVWHELLKSVRILSGTGRSIAERLAAARVAPFTEPSSILLLAALGLILVSALRRGDFRLRSPLAAGLLAGVFVPCILALAGKYARYYCWMAFIPMAACAAAELQGGRARPVRKLVMPLLLLACAAGLPARLAVTCREWGLRDPARRPDRCRAGQADRLGLQRIRGLLSSQESRRRPFPAALCRTGPRHDGAAASTLGGRPRACQPADPQTRDRTRYLRVLRRPLVSGWTLCGGRQHARAHRRRPGEGISALRDSRVPPPARSGCPGPVAHDAG